MNPLLPASRGTPAWPCHSGLCRWAFCPRRSAVPWAFAPWTVPAARDPLTEQRHGGSGRESGGRMMRRACFLVRRRMPTLISVSAGSQQSLQVMTQWSRPSSLASSRRLAKLSTQTWGRTRGQPEHGTEALRRGADGLSSPRDTCSDLGLQGTPPPGGQHSGKGRQLPRAQTPMGDGGWNGELTSRKANLLHGASDYPGPGP